MRRFLPNLNALKAFEAAGRHNSFKGAGEELNLTHSAISRHVRGLEKQLNAELFRTASQGVELTGSGQAYLRAITSALDEISLASEQLRAGDTQSVSVTCEPVFAAKWLMRHISEFRNLHPTINLALVPSGDVADLRMGKYDFAIRYCTRRYSDFSQDLLFEEDVYPYGAPDAGFIHTPDDLMKKRLLHEDDGSLWDRWCQAAEFGQLSLPPSTGPLPAVLAFEEAMASNGILLTSPRLAEYDVKAGRLKRLSEHGMAYGGYRLFCHDHRKLSPVAETFRSWLVTKATQA